MIDLKEFIPTGRSNAISRQELATKLNMCDRPMRARIEEARMRGCCIISTSHAKGYYIAETDDDIEVFERECHSKAVKMLGCARAVRAAWNDRNQTEMPIERKPFLGWLWGAK